MTNFLKQNWLASLITLVCCIINFYHGYSYVGNPSSYTFYSLSAENNNIYLANFLKTEAAIEFKIEKDIFINKPGQLTVFRNNQLMDEVEQITVSNRIIKKFQLLSGDKVCIDSLCEQSSKEGLLFSVYDEQDKSTIATSSFVFLDSSYFPVNETMGVRSDVTSSYLLLNNHSNRLQYIDRLSNNTPYYINYEKSGYSAKKIVWLALSTLLLGAFLIFIFLNYKKIYAALLKDNLFFAIPFTLYIVFTYLTVFPAIFIGDHVLMELNKDNFTEWYSSIYMTYSYLVYFWSKQFIILPTLFLFWSATLYLVNSSRSISKKTYLFICCYLFLFLLFAPYLFIAVYGVQRFFTTAVLFISGLQFIFAGYLRRSKGDSTSHENIIKLGIILIVFSCAMRVEYCIVSIVFIFAIERYFNFVTIKKSALRSLSICAIALSIEFILGLTFSIVYNYDRNVYKVDYKLVTLVNFVDAYAQCPASEKNYIDQNLSSLISQAEICNSKISMEQYFWNKIMLLDVTQRKDLYYKIISTLPQKIIEDPEKMFNHFIIKGYFLIKSEIWSITNKNEISRYNPHLINADRLHMLDYNIFGKDIYNKVMHYYYSLGTYNLFYQVISIILIFFTYPFLFKKNTVCRLTNLSIMALFSFIIIASPSYNQWGYLIFIPLWCFYTIIFIIFEREIRKTPITSDNYTFIKKLNNT